MSRIYSNGQWRLPSGHQLGTIHLKMKQSELNIELEFLISLTFCWNSILLKALISNNFNRVFERCNNSVIQELSFIHRELSQAMISS